MDEVMESQTSAGQGSQEARSVMRQLTDVVSEEARLQFRNLFEQQKSLAAGKLDALAGAFREAANHLSREQHEGFARYAAAAAGRIGELKDMLWRKNFDEFAETSKKLFRGKSVLVLGGGIALGYVAARLLKSAYQEKPRGHVHRTHYQEVPPLH